MIKPRHTALATIALVLGVAAMGPSYAQVTGQSDAAETQQIASAKLGAADAATAAQAALGGRATSVDFENNANMPAYQVTLIMADGSEVEALVDAMTGGVSKAPALTGEQGDQGHTDNSEQGGENQGEQDGENAEG